MVISPRQGRYWLEHLTRLTSPERQLPILDSPRWNENTGCYNANNQGKVDGA
jgi:hypothetical protein